MDFSGAGTAIMVAFAAVLWFLYLLPSWMRRREFLATERNATRLQRAIRVMAESSEAPEEVRIEANAREAAHRERMLAQERRRADAVARAELHAASLRARAAEARATDLARATRAAATRTAPSRTTASSALAGLRRGRRVAGVLLLAALAVAAVQLWLVAATGAVPGSWLVLLGCAAAAFASVAVQRRIASRARALRAGTASALSARRAETRLQDAEPVAAPSRAWTPVPVPRPLYLEQGAAPRVPVVPPVSAEELMRAAVAESERALAAAHAEPEVVPFRAREEAPAPSRFASMGIVDPRETAVPDLDEALRRRRSVG